MPKVEIRSDLQCLHEGMNFLNQDLPDEILCRHTCNIFGKRAFQQYIYFLVQKTSALLIGHDPLLLIFQAFHKADSYQMQTQQNERLFSPSADILF